MIGCAGQHRKPRLAVRDLGFMPYDRAYGIQQQVLEEVCHGDRDDTLLLVEHPPVITLGRASKKEHLLADPVLLARRGIEVRETDRGGDITYHGPGQLVAYPVLDLSRNVRDLHLVIHRYEDSVIHTLAEVWGIKGQRQSAYPGVWVGEAKVAAIGIGVRQWVTYHGLAFNLYPDLTHFNFIVPCGIQDREVTSVAKLLERPVALAEGKEPLARALAMVFELEAECERD